MHREKLLSRNVRWTNLRSTIHQHYYKYGLYCYFLRFGFPTAKMNSTLVGKEVGFILKTQVFLDTYRGS